MKKNLQLGFTLPEVVVVIFVVALVLLALFNLYGLHTNIYNYQQALIEVSSSARDSMSEIGSYALPAKYIMTSQTFNGTVYTTGTSTLILQVPAMDSSGNALGNTWDYVVFYQSGSSLYERVAPDPVSIRPARFRKLSNSVSSLTFTFPTQNFTAASSVSATLLTRKTVRGQNIDAQLQQQWYLRNF